MLAFAGADARHSVWQEDRTAEFRDLGVETIIDLRASAELVSTPSAWQSATGAHRVVELSMGGGEGVDTDYLTLLLSGTMTHFGVDDMAAFYRETIDRRAVTFAAAVAAIAEGGPTLVHCAAGKDRTGLVIALVLAMLGVPDEIIIDDYALTGVLRPNRIDDYAGMFSAAGADIERARALFESPAAAMASTLAHLRDAHGDVETYLVEAGGLAPTVMEGLRSTLLVPA